MPKQEDQAQKVAQWLTHLQGWKASGGSMAAYAKGHGLALWAMYHWWQVLIVKDSGRSSRTRRVAQTATGAVHRRHYGLRESL